MENLDFISIKKALLKDRITPTNLARVDKELFYLECNPEAAKYVYESYLHLKKENIKTVNPNNVMLYYIMGVVDQEPVEKITQSPTVLPDIDYDTEPTGREAIKKYLVKKYGMDKVSLLGTFNTLKVKGAVKDVSRQLRPDMDFSEVNRITAKFNLLKRADYKPDEELKFYTDTIEIDAELKQWLEKNKDIDEAVRQLLGNPKSTGVHAGGIVVSSKRITDIVPLTYDSEYEMWVTQPEMGDVEAAGLIKYDILGLNTLGDCKKAIALINKRHGTAYKLSNIPLEDKEVLNEFKKGNTVSIFQFSTDLVRPNLIKFKSIDGVEDLAIITSIYRPGPMKMGMHEQFILRKNGVEPVEYLHPSLEKHISASFGIVVFQESVMSIVMDLGGLSPNDSLVVLKAMGKKDKAKLEKFHDKFVKNSINKYGMNLKLANEIWDHLVAFAEYGFNRSHAMAYGILSYICMWLKTKYPLEWIAGVLTGADKDDFKIMYEHWSDYIQKPDINLSKDTYFINDDNKRVIMPFSAVNGCGDKAVEVLVAAQPYTSFDDFYKRVDKRKVKKDIVIGLIFSGCLDSMKPEGMSENKFRKTLLRRFFELRHKDSKPSKLAMQQDAEILKKYEGMERTKLLMEEIRLLNFTAFDYHSYYKDFMTKDSVEWFGQPASRPIDVLGLENKAEVVVGGAIESITWIPLKSGRYIGKEQAIIKLTNKGGSVVITIPPWKLETGDLEAKIRKLEDLHPLIVKGKVNIWNGRYGISWDTGTILSIT